MERRIGELEVMALLSRYLGEGTKLLELVTMHSRLVAEKAVAVARLHPELGMDETFLCEAAMLHDIGVGATYAPDIYCMGREPYIRHGVIGSAILQSEGWGRHALVCERHTGTGISKREIEVQGLALPLRDLMPLSEEEQVICFADKFFSKSHPTMERSVEEVRSSLAKFGPVGVERFESWCERYL